MKRILIIEDEIDLLETTFDFLTVAGFDPHTAKDGAEGVQMALNILPDLIICDIAMPKMDGYEVYKALQENTLTSSIPFIFLTAKATMNDLRTGMQLGADDYITKPYSFDDLLLSIHARIKKSEKKNRQNQDFIYSLLDNSYTANFVYQNGNIIYANDVLSELLGYKRRDIIANDFAKWVDDKSIGIVKNKLDLATKGLQNIHFEAGIVTSDKMEMKVYWYINSMLIDNQYSLVVNIVIDELGESMGDDFTGNLESAVNILVQNKDIITKDLLDKLKPLVTHKNHEQKKIPVKLSAREIDVLKLVCKGMSNNEIADKLFISFRTVERHRTNLIRKTNAKNIIDVIVFGLKYNLVEL